MAVSTEKGLLPDERLILRARGHWLGYSGSLGWFVSATAIAGGAFALPDESMRAPVWIGSAVIGVVGLISLIGAWLRRISREYSVTNRRVLVTEGLLSRKSVELLLIKVESIEVEQSLLGRMLGFGTVIVHGTGGMPTRIEKIGDPLGFRNAIQSQVGSPRS